MATHLKRHHLKAILKWCRCCLIKEPDVNVQDGDYCIIKVVQKFHGEGEVTLMLLDKRSKCQYLEWRFRQRTAGGII